MKTILFLYELDQVPHTEKYLAALSGSEREAVEIVALGADIEQALTDREIPFRSGRDLRRLPHIDCSIMAEKIGREVMTDASLSFFSYRNVPLTLIFLPSLQVYLVSVLYFIDVLSSFIDGNPDCKKILLFERPHVVAETDGALDRMRIRVAADVAKLVGAARGVEVTLLAGPTASIRRSRHSFLQRTERALVDNMFRCVNMFVSMRPRKKILILASDYWKHLAPLVEELPESELLLMDRSEALKAGWRSIWRYRMRFVHAEDFVSARMYRDASTRSYEFLARGGEALKHNGALDDANFRGVALDTLLTEAVRSILKRGGERAMCAIDGTYALCGRKRPDIVLVRASFSLQIHFPILCYVARELGIPSVELQHGILYLGPGTFIYRPAPEYIATYGPLTSEGFKRFGYSVRQLLSVGSPRFDEYALMREKSRPTDRPFTVTFIIPAIIRDMWSDSYEVLDYIKSIAVATARIPGAVAICKLRPIDLHNAFYRRIIAEAFGGTPHRIAQYEPLVDVIGESDAIVTIHSTTLFEGLISGRPVIYNASLEFHRALGEEFNAYQNAGALRITRTPDELSETLGSIARDPSLRASLVSSADAFMAEHYAFDGHAAERMAQNIRSLTSKDHGKGKR